MLKTNGKVMDNVFCYGISFVALLVIVLPSLVA